MDSASLILTPLVCLHILALCFHLKMLLINMKSYILCQLFDTCSSVCLRSGVEAAVFSARGGTVLSVLSAQHSAASIQAVEMTEDYLLLFLRYSNTRNILQGKYRYSFCICYNIQQQRTKKGGRISSNELMFLK